MYEKCGFLLYGFIPPPPITVACMCDQILVLLLPLKKVFEVCNSLSLHKRYVKDTGRPYRIHELSGKDVNRISPIG